MNRKCITRSRLNGSNNRNLWLRGGMVLLLITAAWVQRPVLASCPEIDVDVTLADQCGWTAWTTISSLESISSLPKPDFSMRCNGKWRTCKVQTNGNQFRSRRCDGAVAVATGPAAECDNASQNDLAQSPLFLTASVDPNIMFILDDSGSMQWEHMPDHTMYFTTYVFPEPSSLYNGDNYTNQVPDFDDANIHNVFSRSPQNNAVFYNPLVTYSPWAGFGDTTFEDAPPTAAPYNPMDSDLGTLDLTDTKTQSAHWFRNSSNSDPDDAWYSCSVPCNRSFKPITFYMYKGSGDRHVPSNYVKYQIRGDDGYTKDLDGGNETTVTQFTWLDEDGDTVAARTVAEERQNFANWFTYYRSRILAARAGIGRAFAPQSEGMRVGFGAINQSSTTVDGVNSDYGIIQGVRPFSGSGREDFFDNLYNRVINTSGTPLRRALKAAGVYFSRDDNPGPWGKTPGSNVSDDHLSCRQSYTILMTDGFWNGSSPGVSNSDNSSGPQISSPGGAEYQYLAADPYRDAWSNTLGDVAIEYWKKDLRGDVANNVPTNPQDGAFWQHMTTFGVGLGVTGTIEPENAWSAVSDGTAVAWPDPDDSDPAKLDDLLHAGVNSHGGFFTASDPDVFAAELADVLDAIVARVESSATSAAASSAVLQIDTLLYTAGFRSTDWSGTLTARAINDDGTLEPPDCDTCWDADALLRARQPATRNIFTRAAAGSGSGDGVALSWANLHASQQSALNYSPGNLNDGLGSARLDWLRGSDHASLRSRSQSGQLRLLGDIIHSDPQYRDNVLYLGANDGMLHAFNATDGTELFAYIPSSLLLPEAGRNHAPLSRLMDPAYDHRYFMDGNVTVANISVDGTPKTYLVGGMGAGGRTVFALDVTSPASFSAGNVKWEFTHDELGRRPGAPAVARLNDGTWAAIFGNGYGSNSGRASLFIVNLLTGALIQRIETNAETGNALAPPFITDWPARNLRVNRIYAGDLRGDLWVFDVSSASSNQWNNSGNRRTLFTAVDAGGNRQPITSRPYAARVDANRIIMAFGTGSYFRHQDRDNAQVQSLYGIVDLATPAADPVSRANDLRGQEIIAQVTINDRSFRVVSDYSVDYDDSDGDGVSHKGWYLDLGVEVGERVINGPRTLGRSEQRVRFTTLIPDSDPCGNGRRGFLMDIDLLSGGRFEAPVFDLDGDHKFNDLDKIQVTIDGETITVSPSGIGLGSGETLVWIDVRPESGSGDGDYQLICDGQGNCELGRPSDIVFGRQSWRQLH